MKLSFKLRSTASNLVPRAFLGSPGNEVGPVSSIYGVRSSGHPTGQKVKPNMADMEALSYVGFSPPVPFLLTRKHERPRRETETT